MPFIEVDEEEAEQQLRRLVAASEDPTLDDGMIEDLLEQSKRKDSEGIEPDETGWTETWDLNYGAWKGWEEKANRLANDNTHLNDGRAQGSSYSYLNAIKQRDYYKGLSVRVAGLGEVAVPRSFSVPVKTVW